MTSISAAADPAVRGSTADQHWKCLGELMSRRSNQEGLLDAPFEDASSVPLLSFASMLKLGHVHVQNRFVAWIEIQGVGQIPV